MLCKCKQSIHVERCGGGRETRAADDETKGMTRLENVLRPGQNVGNKSLERAAKSRDLLQHSTIPNPKKDVRPLPNKSKT
jgi:hypothetical protein